MLLDNVERKETPGLRRVILMDAFDSNLVEHGKCCGVHVQAMQEVEVWLVCQKLGGLQSAICWAVQEVVQQ